MFQKQNNSLNNIENCTIISLVVSFVSLHKGGKCLKKLWSCVSGEYNVFYDNLVLSTERIQLAPTKG